MLLSSRLWTAERGAGRTAVVADSVVVLAGLVVLEVADDGDADTSGAS